MTEPNPSLKLPMPRRMQKLSLDERGYPVPWFVPWIDGKPEFRAMDGGKFRQALRQKLCWVCGDPLGVNLCFVAGPMCGVNRTSAEPPVHLECGQWSAINCPFLNNPRMVRREDEAIKNADIVEQSAGFALTRNPGVAMVWITRTFEVFPVPRHKNKLLITLGEPERVEFYREGRPATREEVIESVESGLPSLEAMARQEPGGMEALQRSQRRFEKWIPA